MATTVGLPEQSQGERKDRTEVRRGLSEVRRPRERSCRCEDEWRFELACVSGEMD